MAVVLYGYWRSLATFRVRAALNYKGVSYTEKIIDLNKNEQHEESYHRLNSQHMLPVMEHDGVPLTQSLAILEYINEVWPDRPLLPADAAGRARVRALAQITVADTHPLITPRVRAFLEQTFGLDEAARTKWIQHWFREGSAAIEARLNDGLSGKYAHGDQVSLADMALISHVAGARLFKAGLDNAPTLEAIADRCLKLDAFARTHPLQQPGAPAP
ncbi:MAG: uptB [Herbaspirillum sp.]|nr:uptB [Herbaspirillum sp.]